MPVDEIVCVAILTVVAPLYWIMYKDSDDYE